MSGLSHERTGVLVVRLWDAHPGGPASVGRVSSTADLAHTPRSEKILKGEAELRRVVEDWLEAVIDGAAATQGNPPDA